MDRMDLSQNVGYSLWRACNENKLPEVLGILKGNLHLKTVNYSPSGDTPLDQAITHRNEELVLALLAHGGVSLYHERYLKNSELYRWFAGLKKVHMEQKKALELLNASKNESENKLPAKHHHHHSERIDGQYYLDSTQDDCKKPSTTQHDSSDNLKEENERLANELQHEKSMAFAQRQFYDKALQSLNQEIETIKIRSTCGSPSLSSDDLSLKSDSELHQVSQDLSQQLELVIQTLEERKKETCVICLTNSRSHVLIPCGHKLFCEACAGGLMMTKVCPVCRTPIQSILKVFG